jgi:hypothetical protein
MLNVQFDGDQEIAEAAELGAELTGSLAEQAAANISSRRPVGLSERAASSMVVSHNELEHESHKPGRVLDNITSFLMSSREEEHHHHHHSLSSRHSSHNAGHGFFQRWYTSATRLVFQHSSQAIREEEEGEDEESIVEIDLPLSGRVPIMSFDENMLRSGSWSSGGREAPITPRSPHALTHHGSDHIRLMHSATSSRRGAQQLGAMDNNTTGHLTSMLSVRSDKVLEDEAIIVEQLENLEVRRSAGHMRIRAIKEQFFGLIPRRFAAFLATFQNDSEDMVFDEYEYQNAVRRIYIDWAIDKIEEDIEEYRDSLADPHRVQIFDKQWGLVPYVQDGSSTRRGMLERVETEVERAVHGVGDVVHTATQMVLGGLGGARPASLPGPTPNDNRDADADADADANVRADSTDSSEVEAVESIPNLHRLNSALSEETAKTNKSRGLRSFEWRDRDLLVTKLLATAEVTDKTLFVLERNHATDTEIGVRIIREFVTDLLGRDTDAANIFSRRMLQDCPEQVVMSREIKLVTICGIFVANVYIFFVCLAYGFDKGDEWQAGWLTLAITCVIVELLTTQLSQAMLVGYFIPCLIREDVLLVERRMLTSMVRVRKKKDVFFVFVVFTSSSQVSSQAWLHEVQPTALSQTKGSALVGLRVTIVINFIFSLLSLSPLFLCPLLSLSHSLTSNPRVYQATKSEDTSEEIKARLRKAWSKRINVLTNRAPSHHSVLSRSGPPSTASLGVSESRTDLANAFKLGRTVQSVNEMDAKARVQKKKLKRKQKDMLRKKEEKERDRALRARTSASLSSTGRVSPMSVSDSSDDSEGSLSSDSDFDDSGTAGNLNSASRGAPMMTHLEQARAKQKTLGMFVSSHSHSRKSSARDDLDDEGVDGDDDDGKGPESFSASNYLFVSTALAKHHRHLIEAQLVLSYRDPFPSQQGFDNYTVATRMGRSMWKFWLWLIACCSRERAQRRERHRAAARSSFLQVHHLLYALYIYIFPFPLLPTLNQPPNPH